MTMCRMFTTIWGNLYKQFSKRKAAESLDEAAFLLRMIHSTKVKIVSFQTQKLTPVLLIPLQEYGIEPAK